VQILIQMSTTIVKLSSVTIANEDFTISSSTQRECEGTNNIGLDFDEGNSCSEKGHDDPVPRIIMPTNTLVETNKRKTSPRFHCFVFSHIHVCVHAFAIATGWRGVAENARANGANWVETDWFYRVNDAHRYAKNIYKLTYVHKIL